MVQHTPGPWVVIEEDHDISVDGEGWLDGQHVNGWVIIGNPGISEMAVAVLDTGAKNYWQDEKLDANARLIAASPELAEDGQFLIDRLTELDGTSADPVEFMREFYGHVSPVLARFRDTLAKATGAA